MPRQAHAQPLAKYQVELSRLLRQMVLDPRVTQRIREHVSGALSGVQELLVASQGPDAVVPQKPVERRKR